MLSPWSVRGEDLESVAHNSTVQSSEAERRINLASLIEELEGVNPEIKAARQRWEAAKAVVPQVQTLRPETPVRVSTHADDRSAPRRHVWIRAGDSLPR